MTTRERIDSSREARLWVTTIATAAGGVLYFKPDLPQVIADRFSNIFKKHDAEETK